MFTKGLVITFVLTLMLGLSLLITACNARDERPNRDRPPSAPPIASTLAPATETATIKSVSPAPTGIPPTATQTRVSPSLTLVPPTATRLAPNATTAPTPARLAFKKGRNDYVITVDNTPRRMIVYVSNKYDPARATPVVFMFHGSSQSGNVMYESTDWVNKAEEENIITIFPTSWQYPLIGENGLHEKWNSTEVLAMVPAGTPLKDDVHFVRVMLEQVRATFNVDNKRIFATGFSNGGMFVSTRLMAEMNDDLAAFAICGAGLFSTKENPLDPSTIKARVDASLYSIVGTNDELVAEGTGYPRPFPIRAEDIIKHPLFHDLFVATTTVLSLDLAPATESQPLFTRFTFDKSLVGAKNEYIFLMVENMLHVYPNGDNNRARLNASNLFWDFFLRHAKP